MRNKQAKSMDVSVKVAKALADESRMRIVAILVFEDELCVCQFTELLGFAFSTVSRHISLLQTAGLLKSRKEGRWVYYSLSESIPSEIRKWIEKKIVNTEEAKEDRRELAQSISKDPKGLCG